MSQSLEIPLMIRMSAAEVAKVEAWGRARGLNRSAAIRALTTRGLDATGVEAAVAAATREAASRTITEVASRTITDVLYATLPAILIRTAASNAGASPKEVAEAIRDQQRQIRQWIVEAGIPEAALLPPEPAAWAADE